MSSRGDAAERHVPVLRDRIVELLAPALREEGAVCVDGTLGLGGHAEAILEHCPGARLIGLDRDEEALVLARERLVRFGDRFLGVHAVYDDIASVLSQHADGTAMAILFDLGVSSLQLDEPERGFAYRHDAPLDMRMDQSTRTDRGGGPQHVPRTVSSPGSCGPTARSGSPAASRRRSSGRGSIGRSTPRPGSSRSSAPRSPPARSARGAPRQAHLPGAAHRGERRARGVGAGRHGRDGVLAPGGRIAVLSYHSLEDRITKRAFAAGRAAGPLSGCRWSSPSTRHTSGC